MTAHGREEIVGLVTEVVAPYRIPVFNELSELLDGRLRVFFLSAMAGRPWAVQRERIQFSYEIARGIAWQPRGGRSGVLYMNVPLAARLARAHVGPVISGGYNHPDYLWALLHTRARRRPALLWSESVDAAESSKPLRNAIKRRLVQAADGFVVPGSRAAAQIRHLGARDETVHVAPNAVDVAFWAEGARPRGVGGGPMRLLFVGNLHPYKGFDVLLEALDDPVLRELQLDVVGSGGLSSKLEADAAARGIDVRFHGELEPARIRERYNQADVLVLPSRNEPWGLVLNEGMAAGCIPVASTGAGATADLVIDGETGYAVAPGDVNALRVALRGLAADPAWRARLSASAMSHAFGFTPRRCAEGFVTALESLGWLV